MVCIAVFSFITMVGFYQMAEPFTEVSRARRKSVETGAIADVALQKLEFDYLLLGCGTAYPCAPVKPTTAEPPAV